MGSILNFLNNGFTKYIILGFEAYNASTTLIAMFRHPASLDAGLVWATVQPVLVGVTDATGTKINMVLAQKVSDEAVATIRLALAPGATGG